MWDRRFSGIITLAPLVFCALIYMIPSLRDHCIEVLGTVLHVSVFVAVALIPVGIMGFSVLICFVTLLQERLATGIVTIITASITIMLLAPFFLVLMHAAGDIPIGTFHIRASDDVLRRLIGVESDVYQFVAYAFNRFPYTEVLPAIIEWRWAIASAVISLLLVTVTLFSLVAQGILGYVASAIHFVTGWEWRSQ